MSHTGSGGDSASQNPVSPAPSAQSPLSSPLDFSSSSGGPGHNHFSPTANLGAKGLNPEDEAARLAALRLSSRQERIAREEEQARDLTGQRLAETSKYSPPLLTAANPSLPTAATSPPLAHFEDFPFTQFQS